MTAAQAPRPLVGIAPEFRYPLELDTPVTRVLNFRWTVVNDDVMGGKSKSGATLVREIRQNVGGRTGTLSFRGNVSLENNGGFASIRLPIDLTYFGSGKAFVVRARNGFVGYSIGPPAEAVPLEPKRYRFVVQTEAQQRDSGGLYLAEFRVDDRQPVTIPLTAFRASFRGRPVPDAPELYAGDIRSIGFMIADNQAGPFALDITSIVLVGE